MNDCQKDKYNISVFIASIVIFILGFNNAYAATSKDIDATIKLSICGNLVVENPEDCEGADLNGEDCVSQGYLGGNLTCDISCSFNTTGCTPTPSPSPTPIPTASPTPVPTATTQSSSSTSSPSSSSSESQVNLVINLLRQIDAKLKLIQSRFDFDQSGKIEVYELYNTVKTWVADWKIYIEVETAFAKGEIIEEDVLKPEKCDLNNDGVCNVIDLSILLYYIER
ncbi:MAG: hypothetical protein ABIJ05_00050 [Patescibacteria group bacterium]